MPKRKRRGLASLPDTCLSIGLQLVDSGMGLTLVDIGSGLTLVDISNGLTPYDVALCCCFIMDQMPDLWA